MPFTAINVVNGTTPVNATWGNNAQVQYTEATLSFGPDVFTAGFVVSGLVCTKDSVTASKLDVTAGKAYLLQTDGTTRQRKPVASSQTTSVINATYTLALQPDGTWFWTSSGGGWAANSLLIAQATTDASGNILAVTDVRPLSVTLLPGMTPSGVSEPLAGTLYLPTAVGIYKTQNDQFLGTVVGGVTFGQAGALTAGGDNSTGALFNGTTGAVTATMTGLPTGNSSWTLEAIVNVTARPSTSALILEIGANTANQAVGLVLDNAGHLGATVFGVSTFSNAAVVANGTTHHLAATYDGTTLRVYQDGSQVTTGTPAAIAVTAGGLQIGDHAGGSFFFNGVVQEAAVYSTALSAARITAHNTAITGGGYVAAVQTDSPLRYYRLGDAVGATVAADTIPAAATGLITAGGGLANAIPSVAGQPTAGNFGVPVTIAAAKDVHVVNTSTTIICSATTPNDGTNHAVRFWGGTSVGAGATNNGVCNFNFGYSDPNSGSTTQVAPTWNQTNVVAFSALAVGKGLIGASTLPVELLCAPNTTVSVIYQNTAAGTITDKVSGTIELLN